MFIDKEHDGSSRPKSHYLWHQSFIERHEPKMICTYIVCPLDFVHPPLLPVDGEDGPGCPPVLDDAWLRLRALDPTLGHIKRDVDAAAQGAGSQAQANLNIGGFRKD